MASSLSVLQESDNTNTDPVFNGGEGSFSISNFVSFFYLINVQKYTQRNFSRCWHPFTLFFFSDLSTEELPLGQYFVYKLISTQKDFGYSKLLRTDLIEEVSFMEGNDFLIQLFQAQNILLNYMDLPDVSIGNIHPPGLFDLGPNQ